MNPSTMTAIVAGLLMSWSSVHQARAGAPNAQLTSRDGGTEARADLAAGKALKLYTNIHDGRFFHYVTPGLLDCGPDAAAAQEGSALFFERIAAGDFSDSGRYTGEQLKEMDEARRFASAYNRTVFRAKEKQILRVCPQARLAPETSD
jgi:hypothetical protein